MSKRAQDAVWRVVIGLSIAISLLFLIAPLAITTLLSFDGRTYLGPLPPESFSLQWYRRFFSDQAFLNGLKTSLALATMVAVIATAAGVSVAVALTRARFPGREALLAFLLSPLIVPPVVLGFGLLLYLSTVGIVDGFLRLLCGHLILTIPYTVRASLISLSAVPRVYQEAALSLGATERAAFWNVTLPLARNGVAAGAIFSFAISMDDVAVSMFLTDAQTYTLPVALVSAMRANFDLTIAAASVLFMAAILILMLVLDCNIGLSNALSRLKRHTT